MLYSYAGVTEKGLRLFKRLPDSRPATPEAGIAPPAGVNVVAATPTEVANEMDIHKPASKKSILHDGQDRDEFPVQDPNNEVERIKRNTLSRLSIILTLISILVAFRFVPLMSPSQLN